MKILICHALGLQNYNKYTKKPKIYNNEKRIFLYQFFSLMSAYVFETTFITQDFLFWCSSWYYAKLHIEINYECLIKWKKKKPKKNNCLKLLPITMTVRKWGTKFLKRKEAHKMNSAFVSMFSFWLPNPSLITKPQPRNFRKATNWTLGFPEEP